MSGGKKHQRDCRRGDRGERDTQENRDTQTKTAVDKKELWT